MKGYELGRENGKTGAGRYGSVVCAVSMSDKSCSDYVKLDLKHRKIRVNAISPGPTAHRALIVYSRMDKILKR
jgi:NAD(P)-dependent dehydrogenase (short-subunit alcohol dehydrogenase family)